MKKNRRGAAATRGRLRRVFFPADTQAQPALVFSLVAQAGVLVSRGPPVCSSIPVYWLTNWSSASCHPLLQSLKLKPPNKTNRTHFLVKTFLAVHVLRVRFVQVDSRLSPPHTPHTGTAGLHVLLLPPTHPPSLSPCSNSNNKKPSVTFRDRPTVLRRCLRYSAPKNRYVHSANKLIIHLRSVAISSWWWYASFT